MPISRRAGLDALTLDDVLSLDLDSGRAVIDLARVSFVDAYALTGLACFIAAQRYKAGTPEERIVVAVGDAGIGIRESLRTRYGVMTDGQAIRRAVQWNVSSVADEGRGQGLPGVVDGVRGLGGTVWIRSGAASRMVTRGQVRTAEVSRLQGTIVGARLPCRPGR
jgi:hypothetical protein